MKSISSTLGGLAPLLALVTLLVASRPAHAWLLHEHAATAHAVLDELPPELRQRLTAAWAAAGRRVPRLCATPTASGERLYERRPDGSYCLGLPVLTGIAADHSCSPADTRRTVGSEFLLEVLEEAEQAQKGLREAVADKDTKEQIDLWHLHHIRLQVADPDYVTRAETSGAHFQAARRSGEAFDTYLKRVVNDDQPSNAIALYLNYHAAALALAHQASQLCTLASDTFRCSSNGDELLAQAFEAELFALHFLQDLFSSGHQSALSGSRAVRMGTHDHYCEQGVAATTWTDTEYLAHGDAFLDARVDTPRVAAALTRSLTQLAAALSGSWTAAVPPEVLAPRAQFNACKERQVPRDLVPLVDSELVLALREAPRPAADPPGLERFSKELGWFYAPGFGAAVRLGFEDITGDNRDNLGSLSRLPIAAYLGLGLGVTFEGVTDGSTDGVASLGGALLLDARPAGSRSGMRLGGAITWHLPYWLVPFDLFVGTPFLLAWDALFDDDQLFKMGLRSAAGGFLGLQRKITIGPRYIFQFNAGREGMLSFMPPPEDPDRERSIISVKGKPGYIKLALPALSLTTFHASSDPVGLDLVWQLGYDLTYYLRDETFAIGAPKGEVLHGLFLSFSFRSRRYFASF